MRPQALALAIFLGTLIFPLALAAPGAGHVTFQPPGRIEGTMRGDMPGGSAFAAYGISGGYAAHLHIATETLSLERIEATQDFLEVAGNRTCAPPCDPTYHPPQSFGVGRAILDVETLRGNFSLVLRPEGAWKSSFSEARLERGITNPVLSSDGHKYGESLEPFPLGTPSWPNQYMIRAEGPQHHLRPTGASIEYVGRFFLYVTGVEATVRNATGPHVVTADTWEERAPDDPTGLSNDRVRYHHAALVGAIDGLVRIEYSGDYAHLVTPQAKIANVTLLSVPLAAARIEIPGADYESSGSPYLDLRGSFTAAFDPATDSSPSGSTVQVAVAGDFESISENRVNNVKFDSPQVVAATAAGLSVLAMVLLVVSWIRRGVVWVAWKLFQLRLFLWTPFAARLDLARVLDHPVRQGIMEMLAGPHALKPLSDLRRSVAAAFGISSIAAYQHLRVLWRANQLTVVELGKRHYIGPNSGSMGPREQRVAASLLHHPIGLAFAAQFCHRPGQTQAEIMKGVRARLDEPKITDVALLKWIRKFEAVALTPTHAVRAFGSTMNDETGGAPGSVHLVRRWRDETDRRLVRYEASPVLYEVLSAFMGRQADLGNALSDLTRLRVRHAAPQGTSPARPAAA